MNHVSELPDEIQDSIIWYTGGNFDTLNEILRIKKDKLLNDKLLTEYNYII